MEGREKKSALSALLVGDDAYAKTELLPDTALGGLEMGLFFLPRRREYSFIAFCGRGGERERTAVSCKKVVNSLVA